MAGNELGKISRRVSSWRALNAKLRSLTFILKSKGSPKKVMKSDRAGLYDCHDGLEAVGEGSLSI